MQKAARPIYTENGVIFFEGPWAKADYLADGTVKLYAASNVEQITVLNVTEAKAFKHAVGDRRARE